MIRNLCEPILENGIQNINFFNGRLLSAEDMQDEQLARQQHDDLLGQAVGAGVLRGLEVEIDHFTQGAINHTLRVRSGVAINASGRLLALSQEVQLEMAPPPVPALSEGGAFGVCQTDALLPTGTGLYLLVMSPAGDFREFAPMVGLEQSSLGSGCQGSSSKSSSGGCGCSGQAQAPAGRISACGRRYWVEGVQFRLVKLDLTSETLVPDAQVRDDLKGLVKATNRPWPGKPGAIDPIDDLPQLSRLRNQVAYLCFGAATLSTLPRDPFRLADGSTPFFDYGLLSRLASARSMPITADDAPLALLYWTDRGLRFADNWSVRRRPYVNFNLGPWSALLPEQRIRESEAMILQFNEQLGRLLAGYAGFEQVALAQFKAKDYFRYLPPAGLLPGQAAAAGLSQPGVNLGVFFQGLKVRDPLADPLFMEGAAVPGLLRQALAYPPIDTTSAELVWLYQVRENRQAIDLAANPAGVSPGPGAPPGLPAPPAYLVFAGGHLPFYGDARFDANYWNYSNWG